MRCSMEWDGMVWDVKVSLTGPNHPIPKIPTPYSRLTKPQPFYIGFLYRSPSHGSPSRSVLKNLDRNQTHIPSIAVSIASSVSLNHGCNGYAAGFANHAIWFNHCDQRLHSTKNSQKKALVLPRAKVRWRSVTGCDPCQS